jgi:hypothetical protein
MSIAPITMMTASITSDMAAHTTTSKRARGQGPVRWFKDLLHFEMQPPLSVEVDARVPPALLGAVEQNNVLLVMRQGRN